MLDEGRGQGEGRPGETGVSVQGWACASLTVRHSERGCSATLPTARQEACPAQGCGGGGMTRSNAQVPPGPVSLPPCVGTSRRLYLPVCWCLPCSLPHSALTDHRTHLAHLTRIAMLPPLFFHSRLAVVGPCAKDGNRGQGFLR